MQTFQNFTQELGEAIDKRLARSKDPKTEALTLADFKELIQRALATEEWRPAPGYPKRLSKESRATNSASLSELQRGLGPPMTTFHRTVMSEAEEKQARSEGWL